MATPQLNSPSAHPLSALAIERDEARSRLVAALLSRAQSYERERKDKAAHS